MSEPTTGIGFSASTPAAPAGYQVAVPQSDGGAPLQKVTFSTPNVGGVSAKTANYTAVAGDNGMLLSFDCASAVTLTLPAAVPFASWNISVQNIGAGTLTINRNGLDIDGAAANLTVPPNMGCTVFTDSANYFTERGISSATGSVTSVSLAVPSRQSVAGSPVTGSGTLTVTDNAQSANQVFAGPASGSTAAPGFRALVTADLPANDLISTIGVTIDGGGSTPATGTKGFIQVPFGCTITGWSLVADQSGSASIDIWAVAGSSPPTAPSIPTSANKISASAPAELSSAQSAAGGSSAISTWTTAVAQWTTIGFSLSSVTTCTRLTLELQVTRT